MSDELEFVKISELPPLPNNDFTGFYIIGTKENASGVPTSYAVSLTVLGQAIAAATQAATAANNAAEAADAAARAFLAIIVQQTGQNTDKVMSQKAVTDALGNKVDKSAGVTGVAYDTGEKKLKKTINGATSEVVTAAKVVEDGGAVKSVKVNNTSQTVTNNEVNITVPVASDADPKMDGSKSPGTGTAFSRSDHVHPSDSSKANKSETVSDVSWDDNNGKLKKTINGTTSDIVTLDTTPTTNSKKPISSGGVKNAIADFITKSVNDLVYYYTKSQTYTKDEVQQIIATVRQFTYEVVNSLPTASADTMNKIYLVPSSNPQTQNVKDEYITVRSGSEGSYTYAWEQIGSTTIDLSGYYTSAETDTAISNALSAALASYSTTTQMQGYVAGIIADYYTEAEVDQKFTDLSLSVVDGKLCQTFVE